MSELNSGSEEVGRDRARSLIVPREHGAWGLLLVPLFTGVAAGIRSTHQLWPLLLFMIAALCLFWLRTPVESLVGSGPIFARTPEERRKAVLASAVLLLVAAASLIEVTWRERHLQLLLIGAIAAFAFVVQLILRTFGRETRMAAQLSGAVSLTGTASAAYYLAAGRLDPPGIALWVTNWLFAWNQIHFVQLRIHTARIATLRDKFARGLYFFLGQLLLLTGLIFAAFWRFVPPLVILAFVPVLVRGTRWFFRGPEPLDVRKLGWAEVKQGVAFGILLVIAFLVR